MRLTSVLALSAASAAALVSEVYGDEDNGIHAGGRRNLQNCICDVGSCKQGDCDQGATCGGGRCNQEGLLAPSCDGGHCNQRDSVNPSCGAGHCDQTSAYNATCGDCYHPPNATVPTTCNPCLLTGVCIGGGTQLFSCTENEVVSARDVSIGDQVRALSSKDGSSVCSDVYYVYAHKEDEDVAVRIATSLGEHVTVSYDHLVYVGDSFETRRPVHSQNVQPGDKLVTTGDDSVEVVEVKSVGADLVNVLTIDPHLQIQTVGGSGHIVISAHAVDHDAYGALFAPVRYIYLTFGASAVEYMSPFFSAMDYSFGRTGVNFMKTWMVSSEK